tara:strand:+ start:96 stop:833 length:738 start_codon:yes stop_codon:yes gene_type:complete
MKTSTAKNIKTHSRQTNKDLATSLIRIINDRQPDMTELMLNDIDDYRDSTKKTGPSGCCYRLKDDGDYFTTKDGDTVQLSFSARKRLVLLTGGSAVKIKNADGTVQTNSVGKPKEELIGGAFSSQDFRRCFDYIKSCGAWIEDDTGREFVIDTDEVNNAMRNGHRWDSLNRRVAVRSRRNATKSIKITHHMDLPDIKNGKFSKPKKAEEYYTLLVKYIMNEAVSGGVSLDVKINGTQVLTSVDSQ